MRSMAIKARVRARYLAPASAAAVATALAVGVLAACGAGDVPFAEVDPQSIPETPTYEQHIRPRLDFYCLSCHSADSPLGTKGDVDWSTYDAAKDVDTIGFFAVEERTMPPGAGRRMTARDWAIFVRWKQVGFPR